MITRKEIKEVVDLFLTWNNSANSIGANLDSAVNFIDACINTPNLPLTAPTTQLDEETEWKLRTDW